MTHPIIFDTDPGVDDVMALVFAHCCPSIELVGITTVRGNADVATTTRNALHVTERFGIDVPVHAGADAALFMPAGNVPDFVHGKSGLGHLDPPAPERSPASHDAAGYLVEALRARPGEITLVAVGRLTNLAEALARAPDIAGLARSVVIMGGALGRHGIGGNVSPCAEANIHGDPHAADQVFAADWPVTMVGLDVTMQVIMDHDRMVRIRDGAGAYGAFVWEVSRFYADFYASRGYTAGFPVHDSSALAYVVEPEVFTVQHGAVRVVTDGIAIGQTIQSPGDKTFPPGPWDDRPAQTVAVDVEPGALLDLYELTLTGAA